MSNFIIDIEDDTRDDSGSLLNTCNPCPDCQMRMRKITPDVTRRKDHDGHTSYDLIKLTCPACLWSTKECTSVADAVEAWNSKASV